MGIGVIIAAELDALGSAAFSTIMVKLEGGSWGDALKAGLTSLGESALTAGAGELADGISGAIGVSGALAKGAGALTSAAHTVESAAIHDVASGVAGGLNSVIGGHNFGSGFE